MTADSSELLIALSAGGDVAELADQGLGTEHVEELMVQMAMKLLREGHQLSFGGTLGVADKPLTSYLINTAQSWLNEESANQGDVTKPETWPLVNYAAWPYHTLISSEQRASLVGVCRFEKVDPPRVRKTKLDEFLVNWKTDPRSRLYTSDALTAMRERSAREADIRIVWGGKIAGAAGWMAGILEEVAFSLQFKKPTMVLGGFGGCARLIAEFLADKNAPWPESLGLDACTDAERDKLQTAAKKKKLQARFNKIKQLILSYRTKLHSNRKIHGMSSKQLRDSLLDESPRRVVRFAAHAANKVSANR